MSHSGESVMYFPDKVMYELQQFRATEQFCDIRFTTDQHQQSFVAHRLVLAASSEYFRKLFQSKLGADAEICVQDVDSQILEMLINYCYTGRINVNEQNAQKLLSAATVLQLNHVVNKCANFLREQMANNDAWLKVLKTAEEVNLKSLRDDVLHYVIVNFIKLSQRADFLDINATQLESIIENDQLHVTSERDVFYAIKRWYEHDADTRCVNLAVLMGALRITQLDTTFILEQIRPLPGCEKLAMDALDWIHIPSKRNQITLKYTQMRQMYDTSMQHINWTLIALPVATSAVTSVLQYNTECDEWNSLAVLALKRCDYKMMIVTNRYRLFFFGGRFNADKKASDYVGSYDLITAEWRRHAPMQKCREGMCVAQWREHIYVIGGKDRSFAYLNTVERYDLDADEWCTVRSMQSTRWRATATVYNDKIYVIGGFSDNYRTLRSTECYNPQTDSWNLLATMHEARHSHAAVLAHDKIYVMGGWNAQSTHLQTVECYEPSKNKWTKVCVMHEARAAICGVFFNNRLMALGGIRSDAVEVYDFEQDTWKKSNSLPFEEEYNCALIPTYFAKTLAGGRVGDA